MKTTVPGPTIRVSSPSVTSGLATLVGVTDVPRRHGGPDSGERSIAKRVRDQSLRAEFGRLHAEMVGARATATDGPIVNPGRPRRGRLVFGDATE